MLKKLYKKYVTTPHNIKTTKSLISEINKGNVTEINVSVPEFGIKSHPSFVGENVKNLAASSLAANLNRDDKIALQRALRIKGKKKRKK
jgi:hypothetical protein